MPQRLVVCCDGTWNVPDRKDGDKVSPSNVVHMALAAAPRDARGVEQRVYYQKGVGTGVWDRVRGGAFGWGLSQNILDAYRFVVERFEPGDELFLFGFSRGAYTARSLGGLIRNSGIVRRDRQDQIVPAYNLYRRRGQASHPTEFEAALFRKTYAHETRIRFIGVWDTVGALGIPVGIPWLPVSWLQSINQRWAFHDVKLSSYVDFAYHAVAVDERRPQFVPTLWEQQPHAEAQTMEQVWFAGVHTNVGGGYQDAGLSDITFLWMKEKAQARGLAFDGAYVERTFRGDPCGVLRDSKTGFYSRFPDAVRPMGVGAFANEAVHHSAVQRMEQCPGLGYTPPNLMDHLRRGGRVTP